jgi:hypothetical protein
MASLWSELTTRERPAGLQTALRRQIAPGQHRYTFVHDDVEVDDPSVDATGRFFVSPREYGFAIRGFQGGKTAWARDFENGTMLVVNSDGVSHVLSPRSASRVLFVGHDGSVLQDSGLAKRTIQRTPELATIRLTINATVDLHGESPEAARAVLMRMVDRAILNGPVQGETEIEVVEHAFELSAVVTNEVTHSSDTNFSQLLGI